MEKFAAENQSTCVPEIPQQFRREKFSSQHNYLRSSADLQDELLSAEIPKSIDSEFLLEALNTHRTIHLQQMYLNFSI